MGGFSKREQTLLLEIISNCVTCESPEEVQKITGLLDKLVPAGKIIFLHAQLPSMTSPPEIHELNISYPEEWEKIYKARNYAEKDPILQRLDKSGLVYWQDIYQEIKPCDEFCDQAQKFGLANGFSHIHLDHKSLGLMSIADSDLQDCERTKEIITMVAPHFHQLVAKIFSNKVRDDLPHLTPREKEVLQWATQGKSNWEISVILNIGQESVKGHMSNILRKMEAANRAHAVAIALQNNLIPFNL